MPIASGPVPALTCEYERSKGLIEMATARNLKQLAISQIAPALAALVLALGAPYAAHAQGFSVSITVDENGNGRLFNEALRSGFLADPGPGGLPSVLTYGLFDPPGLTSGDVL